MMMKKRTEQFLGILIACGAIISACIGLFYSEGGPAFFVDNVYGQPNGDDDNVYDQPNGDDDDVYGQPNGDDDDDNV